MITVNCLETRLLNLSTNYGVDTIRNFSLKAKYFFINHRNVGYNTARYFEFDKSQRDQLPDYRGPLPDVFNCQSGT